MILRLINNGLAWAILANKLLTTQIMWQKMIDK